MAVQGRFSIDYKMKIKTIHIFSAIVLLSAACKKESSAPSAVVDPCANALVSSDPKFSLSTFQGLHANIFGPTCANSGCHDGTFEPDYRTIQSTYNSLVNQKVTKTEATGSYQYRVEPGHAERSMLILRLTKDIDGLSGIMPLYESPASCYSKNKVQYIEALKTWINNGAVDAFGNKPSLGNKEPELNGVMAFIGNGAQPLERRPNGAIQVPAGTTNLELWFSVSDDVSAANELSNTEINLSNDFEHFEDTTKQSLQIAAPTKDMEGYLGDVITYNFKATVDVSRFSVNSPVFIRIYVKDPQHATTEIPRAGAAYYIVRYASLILQ